MRFESGRVFYESRRLAPKVVIQNAPYRIVLCDVRLLTVDWISKNEIFISSAHTRLGFRFFLLLLLFCFVSFDAAHTHSFAHYLLRQHYWNIWIFYSFLQRSEIEFEKGKECRRDVQRRWLQYCDLGVESIRPLLLQRFRFIYCCLWIVRC